MDIGRGSIGGQTLKDESGRFRRGATAAGAAHRRPNPRVAGVRPIATGGCV